MDPPYSENFGAPIHHCPILNSFSPAGFQSLHTIITGGDEIKIDISNHFTTKRYRPGSVVEGTVTLNPQKRLEFAEIAIKLVCNSSIETYHNGVPLEIWHRLLDLTMPVSYNTSSQNRTLQANQIYKIPFHFVLPQQFSSEACTQNGHCGRLSYMHSQMPPSLTGWERKSLVSRNVRLGYGVIAQVLNTGSPRYANSESKHTFQFLPAPIEHPWRQIPVEDKTYRVQSSKTLTKGLLARPEGQITLSTVAPRFLLLDTGGKGFQSTSIQVHLRLDLFNGKQALPEDCTVSASLKSETWSQDKPMQDWPHLANRRDSYSDTETVAEKALFDVIWVPNNQIQSSVTSRGSSKIHKARLTIPLRDLATDEKFFLPTFYSSLVARTYQLQIHVKIASTTLKVVVPIQLATDTTESCAVYSGSEGSSEEVGSADRVDALPAYSMA
jgi:hypothetical protein